MGRMVIVAYQPRPGKFDALRALVENHMPILREEGLVTDRPSCVMYSQDNTVIEVFEWRSREAMAAAHDNPRVVQLWQEFSAVCDYVPIAAVPEAKQLFSEFMPLDDLI